MDEIKSLSFHIMFYRLYRGVAKYIEWMNDDAFICTLFLVIPFHHLSDCDLYTPPTTGREGETEAGEDENEQPGQNEELVPKRGTTSVAWTCVFKHCSFKTTDFKALKIKQQSYMRAPSLSVWEERAFSFLPTEEEYASESPSLQVSS